VTFTARQPGRQWGQDAIIDAVATVNPNTIVVLETGNPVSMPWRDKAKAILQAWYPGQAGGQAIAEILTGRAGCATLTDSRVQSGSEYSGRPRANSRLLLTG
jgi:beta-glucosidase